MGTQPYRADPGPASSDAAERNPWLLVTVLLVALLSLFLWAGFWQLDRAEFKNQKQAQAEAAQAAPPVPRPVGDAEADRYRFRAFELNGYYLPDRQVLLDNIIREGKSGYEVLTPFVTPSRTVLVNRGWLPADPDRSRMPQVPVDDAPRTILAYLDRLPAPGLRLASPETTHGWPKRLLFPSRDTLAALLDRPLPNYQLRLDPSEPDGYARSREFGGDGPDQHIAYATQWFAFAALAVIFYCILIVRRRGAPPANTDTRP